MIMYILFGIFVIVAIMGFVGLLIWLNEEHTKKVVEAKPREDVVEDVNEISDEEAIKLLDKALENELLKKKILEFAEKVDIGEIGGYKATYNPDEYNFIIYKDFRMETRKFSKCGKTLFEIEEEFFDEVYDILERRKKEQREIDVRKNKQELLECLGEI